MALPTVTQANISNIIAATYNAVLTKSRTAENQWAENSVMRFIEKMGGLERRSLGPNIEETLDWQMNQEAGFTSNDMAQFDLSQKTEFLTAARYDVAELTAPIKWSKKDEVQNPSENQKVDYVKGAIKNALTTHDALIEQGLATTSTNGFLGFRSFMDDSGTPNVGGINASSELPWRNQALTGSSGYAADGSDIDAKMTTIWNSIIKGTGSPYTPKLVISGATPHALVESGMQAQQRYEDTSEANRGFKALTVKDARYIFSQYFGTRIFFWNPEVLRIVVSKEYFRDKSETIPMADRNAFIVQIYSALQLVGKNNSRCGVLDVAP